MVLAERYYPVQSEEEADRALHHLHDHLPSRLGAQVEASRVYYDTFDWRLYKARSVLTLTIAGRQGTIRWNGLEGTARCRLRRLSMPPFAADFPRGPCRAGLTPIIATRRLLPLVRLACRSNTLTLLDDRRKTIVTVTREERTAYRPGDSDGMALEPALRVTPVKGYAAAVGQVRAVLEGDLGLQPDDGELAEILAAIGRAPGDYSSKPDLALDRQMTAAEAVRLIHRQLLATMQANEAGLRDNLDEEFLHDFRVASRRARSALGQIKAVFPQEVVDRYRKELSWIGSVTGPTRDLDVYLAKMGDYRGSLPEVERDALVPLQVFLEAHHRTEHRRLVEALDSPRYREVVEGWRRFLDNPPSKKHVPANATRPVCEVASARIWKVYRRVLKNGRAIAPDSPATALHRLRIDCKKLRYLMELFRSLYDAEAIVGLIDSLKRLQDNLGDFNDCTVQQATLRRIADQMAEENGMPVATLLAMGHLLALLEERQATERARFAEQFAQFSSDDHRQLFRRLFAPPGKGTSCR
jgi:CHAD domain-containing protein